MSKTAFQTATIKHIVLLVEDAFKEDYPSLKHDILEKELNQWIDDDMEIVNHTIIPGDKIVIVVKKTKVIPDLEVQFSVYRFFPLNNKWIISVDLDGRSQQKLIEHLMKHYK